MAELHVQPKRSNPWWLWLILAVVVAGLLYYFLRDNDKDRDNVEIEDDEIGLTTDIVTPGGEAVECVKFTRIA